MKHGDYGYPAVHPWQKLIASDQPPSCLPSGKRLQKTMERSIIFNGKIHYFYGHFQ